MTPPLAIKLADADAERVRQSHDRAVREIQAAPAMGMLVVEGVSLPDSVRVPIPHRLGRAPSWVGPSAVRGTLTPFGSIQELRDGVDRSQRVELMATGYGATVTIDLLVVP